MRPMPLEVLDLTLVLLGGLARFERSALVGFGSTFRPVPSPTRSDRQRLATCFHQGGEKRLATYVDVGGTQDGNPVSDRKEHAMPTTPRNTICLWFDKDAEAAARFYAETFPDTRVGAVHRAPSDFPSGKKGDVLTVEFTVAGIPCIGLNGGSAFKQSEAFSFQIATDDQQETDRYWNAIVGNGGQESACGWCKDKWGVSWQITPRTLTEAMAAGGDEAKRAFDAMMDMRKIDVAAIDAARRG
jgi:predicted 3-demethylubiquinone-9 3-methyltransferase (glyoxalase superfamily)